MGADKEIIVAIELGSSAIRGIAGTKEPDGNMHILAIEQEDINYTASIRRGVVYNIDKTTSAIERIKSRLNEKLGVFITRAYVGINGQSLHSASNRVVRHLNETVKISPELIDSILDENHGMIYPNREILEVVPQEYLVGTDTAVDPIGIQSNMVEGRFQNIIARTSLQENIRKCMRDAGLEVVELFITPIEVARNLLPDSEKRSGCALVDMGAQTTTVAVYTKNILRHLAVLPIGSNNITHDIATIVKVELDEAESLKIRHGVSMINEEPDGDSTATISISNDREIEELRLQEIVSARTEEIILNIDHQIKNFKEQLLSGIVLTGGGSQLKGISEAVGHYTSISRIRPAKNLLASMSLAAGVDASKAPNFNSVVSILLSGKESCTSTIAPTHPEPIIEVPVSNTDNTDAENTQGSTLIEVVPAEENDLNKEIVRKPKRNLLGKIWKALTDDDKE